MNTKFNIYTNQISEILNEWEEKLAHLSAETVSTKRNKQNRTIKQILGHLIDSASNNHQRIVRLQYNENLEFPDYRQDNDLWLAVQKYENADWQNLVQLWKFYNLHIIQIIEAVNETKLTNYWTDFEGTKVTLEQMIIYYPKHLTLHINEIKELLG